MSDLLPSPSVPDVSDVAGFSDAMSKRFGATIILPDNPIREAILSGAMIAMKFAKLDSPLLVSAIDRLDAISVTLGSFIVLSANAVSDPVTRMEVVAHECTHVSQVRDSGIVQNTLDYLFSAELRTKLEADAYGAGAFVRYLLTGSLPDVSDTASRLSSGPYALSDVELSLATEIARSHLETMVRGTCPPVKSAIAALEWLRTNNPNLIRVPAFLP